MMEGYQGSAAEGADQPPEEPPGIRRGPSSPLRRLIEEAPEVMELVVQTIPEAIVVVDEDARILAANEAFSRMSGIRSETISGRPMYEIGEGRWDVPEVRRLLSADVTASSADDVELELGADHHQPHVVRLEARRTSERMCTVVAIHDLTQVREAQNGLQAAQERFDLLAGNAKEYAIFMMDPQTRITTWNRGATRILGWSEEDVLGRTGDLIFTPEDRRSGIPQEEVERALREGSSRDDRWHNRKDGTRFWATGYMIALYADSIRGFAKILRDDTRHKEADEERKNLIRALEAERSKLQHLNETLEVRVEEATRQVRDLAATLTMAEQQERRRVSQTLHDDLQQQLYGIQMKLALARRSGNAGDHQRLIGSIEQAEEWLDSAISTTRTLTVELSPPLLRDEGLRDALDWLVTHMQNKYGLSVDVQAGHSFHIPDQDIRVLLFQVARELLFNVVKHASVDRARIELEQLDGHFVMRVSDEGKGFDLENIAAAGRTAGGFGLFSAGSRLELLGGRIEIATSPGEGTTVSVYTPSVLKSRLANEKLREEAQREE